jgi:hypothetical protein
MPSSNRVNSCLDDYIIQIIDQQLTWRAIDLQEPMSINPRDVYISTRIRLTARGEVTLAYLMFT